MRREGTTDSDETNRAQRDSQLAEYILERGKIIEEKFVEMYGLSKHCHY